MALYDRTIFIQAPPELVWTEVRQAAGTHQVVIEQPGRLLLVRGAFSRGIAYALDRLPDGSTRLRRMVDNLAVLQRVLTSGASPQVALATLAARPDRTNPFDALAGNRAINRICASAQQAARTAGWAPRPPAGEAPTATEASPRPPGRSPWHPGDLFWLAVPFSFVATGILIALNWRHLDQPRRAWLTLGITGLAALGCVAFIRYFSQNIYTNPIGLLYAYLFSLGLAYGLVAWQNLSSAYENWTALHGNPSRRKSGCLIPILVSLASAVLVLTFTAELTLASLFPSSVSISHFKQGVTLQSQGSLDAALAEYDQAILTDPALDEAYNNRCVIRLYRNELPVALADCSRAVELQPRNPYYLANRAQVYQRQGSLTEALTDLSRAITLNPKNGNSYLARGMVYLDNGMTTQAIADLEKALTLDLDDQARQLAQDKLSQLKP